MKFAKMHGCGNDYIYINCLEETVENPGELSERLSERHFGIGSDGLILIKPSEKADFEMDMYNADGSQGAMCGNGIRCVAKYVYDFGLTDKTEISVDTKSGVKELQLDVEDGKVKTVRVNMGSPEFDVKKIPVEYEGDEAIDAPILIAGREYHFTGVSMGNPHAVVFVDDVENFPIGKIGPLFERHAIFPDRVNTEFIRPIDDHTIEMRVWERGAGETLACGTGACAAGVAAIRNGKVKGSEVTVMLRGGVLKVEWDREANQVYLIGPAELSFTGELPAL